MVVRGILLVLVVLTLLVVGLTQATADDTRPPKVCVSAVGPVDAGGHGETTPVEAGECP